MSVAMTAQLASRGPVWRDILAKALVALVSLAILFAAWVVYAVGQALFGACLVVVALAFFAIYGFRQFYFARFIFPGAAAVLLFILFPVLYTIYLGFTNYSSFNLLTFERTQNVLLSGRIIDEDSRRPFALVAEGEQYRVFLPQGEGGFLSGPAPLDGEPASLTAEPVETAPQATLEMRDVVALRDPLSQIEVTLPDQTVLRASGLREFAYVEPEYELIEDEKLRHVETGEILTPNHQIGFYVREDGSRVTPGWRVFIGTGNFERIFQSQGIRGPLVGIFLWTVGFAVGSTILCFSLGLLLATILQWEHMRFRAAYRILLILPYAVPAFISILVFRGLFNQNFGEINLILNAIFGIRPAWFTDGFLARTMLLIVNVWLGYPYMMLLGMGFLQAVPQEQKKAAILEGAGALRVFFTITLPQILPPFLPLLLATFAFNFNNIVLILLLTTGGPDIPGTVIPAGQTDILGSFTFRMAFMDSGQQFGLAGAITLIIFLVVTVISYANFVAMRRTQKGVVQ
ncbi:MAG: maltose ABC transporter permease MalF [Pelagibacterium sp.]|uniref:maltose ABC transporter permease MalF n=1 Tax=Pelagibacterium sp. TaxID=1967288 RepID=UPI0032F065EC